MRITDLARRLKIPTEELRPHLSGFGVSQDSKEIDNTLGVKIFSELTSKIKNKKVETEDPEQELMGMFFEETEEDKETSVPEETTEEKQLKPEEEVSKNVSQKTEENEERVKVKKEKSQPAPATTVAKTTVAKPAKPQQNGDQEAARARWARAKKASEKLLVRKVKKMEKDKVKRLTRQQEKLEEAMHSPSIQTAAQKGEIKMGDVISVRELGEKMGVSPIRVVGELLKNGVMSNLNQTIDFDTASIVCGAFNCSVSRDTAIVSSKDILKGNIKKLLEDNPENLVERPPIVAVMGHVDHGKTTLLDTIRKTNIVSGESGGITQHIGAYQVEHNGRKITFLDTPGHEAFTTMRARGAHATDIAIIVVAAEEGVKPQTIEAINHARDAEIPIIVAITKIDKPSANIDKVKGELAEHDLQASDWGGKTEIVGVSNVSGQGIEDLLELVLLTNDLDPVNANPNREAVCTIIESHLNKSLGPIVTVLVNTGTLKISDNFVIGAITGRVKKMFNYLKKPIKKAKPGTPVQIAGLDKMPKHGVGEILQVLPTIEDARKKAIEMQKLIDTSARKKVTGMNQLISRINAGEMKELKIVLKADVEGSLEAIRENIEKIGSEKIKTKIIHSGVGDVTETDVLMAAAADGLLIAFHTKIPPAVVKIANREGVSIRQHTIIYKLLEEIKKMLSGMLDPEEIEIDLGKLQVRGVFYVKGKEQTIGGIVKSGVIKNNANIRIFRDEKLIDESKIISLKREKETAKEVKEGFECGLKISSQKVKIQEGDIIQAWKTEKKKPVLI